MVSKLYSVAYDRWTDDDLFMERNANDLPLRITLVLDHEFFLILNV